MKRFTLLQTNHEIIIKNTLFERNKYSLYYLKSEFQIMLIKFTSIFLENTCYFIWIYMSDD